MRRPTLSVAIIAQNEEENLRRVLPALTWADEIILVDSGSTDGTVAVAKSFCTRVLYQPWLGFGAQKNFAIDQCAGDWILSLDADEAPSAELTAAIPSAIADAAPELAGFLLNRKNFFLGQWMRHGGYYPDPKLRLFRRGRARFENRPVHESMTAEGPVERLRAGDLVHHTYPTLALYLEHMNRYSTAGAPPLVKRDRGSRSPAAFFTNVLLNPLATFTYNYILRAGFLDGREGFLLHLYHSSYISWKYAKAWEQAHGRNNRGEGRAAHL